MHFTINKNLTLKERLWAVLNYKGDVTPEQAFQDYLLSVNANTINGKELDQLLFTAAKREGSITPVLEPFLEENDLLEVVSQTESSLEKNISKTQFIVNLTNGVEARLVLKSEKLQTTLQVQKQARKLDERRPPALQINNSQPQKKRKPLQLEDFLTVGKNLPAAPSTSNATDKPITYKHGINKGKGRAILQRKGEPVDDLIGYINLRLTACKNFNKIIAAIVENPAIISNEFASYINETHEDGISYKAIIDELKNGCRNLLDTDPRKAKLEKYLDDSPADHMRPDFF